MRHPVTKQGLDSSNLTPKQREKLYLAEVRRLDHKVRHAMTKSVVEFTNKVGLLNPEAIKRLKNFLIALKLPVEKVKPISGKTMAEYYHTLFHANPASMHSTFTIDQLLNMNVNYWPSPIMDVNYLPRVYEVVDSSPS